jgi:hypothetical protein
MNEVQIDLSQGPDSLKRKFVGAYILGGSPERLRQCVKINIVPNVGIAFYYEEKEFYEGDEFDVIYNGDFVRVGEIGEE